MKKTLYLFCLANLIACKPKEANFSGIWMAYKVENMHLKSTEGLIEGRIGNYQNSLDSFANVEECRVLSFEKDDILLDDGEIFGQNIGSWKILEDTKQLSIKSVRGSEKFDVIKATSKVIVLRKQYLKTEDSLIYTLYPFEGKNVAEMKTSLRYLMTKATQAESDEQIKTRLKHALLYYANYFYTINDDKRITSFRPMHIYLPIQFYSGGIGIKNFEPKAEWVYIFYNGQDALKALNFLSNSLKKVGVFPSHNNRFALEYADVLKEMASNL